MGVAPVTPALLAEGLGFDPLNNHTFNGDSHFNLMIIFLPHLELPKN